LNRYKHRRSGYFVAVGDGEVLGGAGIFPLEHEDWGTCELQRMYVRPEHRGRGIGKALLTECLDTARSLGFSHCYAETVSATSAAIRFYQRNGVSPLNGPLGGDRPPNDHWMMLSTGAKLEYA
jgi:putative acetyltransferase